MLVANLSTDIVDSSAEIKNLIASFGSNQYEVFLKSVEWMRENIKIKKYPTPHSKMAEWRTRKASEVFRSKEANGCTDYAVLLTSLMRTAHIACSYIETVSQHTVDVLKTNKSMRTFSGHTLCRVKLNDLELLVDPTYSQIFLNPSLPQPSAIEDQHLLAEGSDFQKLNLTTVDSLVAAAKRL